MLTTTTAAAAMMLFTLAAGPESANYARPELLVEAAQLPEADVIVLDARPRDQYVAGHIPGARFVNAADWAKAFDQGQDIAGWQTRIGALGLTPTTKLVIYDDNLSKDAARVWWILRFWGFEDVRLLNGGWKAWQAADGQEEAAIPPEPTATKPDLAPVAERLATKEQILETLDAGSLQIVDARSEGEFCGDEPVKNQRGGAIPGAKHLEWDDLLDPQTGKFLPAPVLSELFANSGVDLAKPTATHCQSGGRSSVMAFGMELMGAKNVSNYYRSWHEWGNAADTPVVKGAKKP